MHAGLLLPPPASVGVGSELTRCLASPARVLLLHHGLFSLRRSGVAAHRPAAREHEHLALRRVPSDSMVDPRGMRRRFHCILDLEP